MAFAIIETGGKQYRVSPGDKIKVEKITSDKDIVSFDRVLMTVDGETVTMGTPLISGATVTGKVLSQGRAKKVIVFKYASKTRRRTKKGHRQQFTEVEITNV